MFKCIALLKKKPGLSRAEFIEYYENRHSVMARKLLPGIRDYRRNFVDPDGAVLSPGAPAIDFDVVTEMWFADRAACDVFLARARDPDIARQIAEDEENLFDRSATRMFVVEEKGAAT